MSSARSADVASQKVNPDRSSGIQLPSGTRTPVVVPFQVKITSREKSTFARSGKCPGSASNRRTSGSFNSSTTSRTQLRPKTSQASTSTPRGPSRFHMASSRAPVSEPGTIAASYPGGKRSASRVRSMASFRRLRPSLERCERPTRALPSTSGRQPGRFAQGPDEKNGWAGFVSGFGFCDIGPLVARQSRHRAARLSTMAGKQKRRSK